MGAMMRSYFLRAGLALVVLVLPALGGAMPGPFIWKAERFTPLGGSATVWDEWESGEPSVIDLDFDFEFYGQTFNQVRFSHKGYIALGYKDPKGVSSFEPDSALENPRNLNSSAKPNNIIAAWWGNHHCDPNNSVKYQDNVGSAPEREFRVEWDCSADSDELVSFKAQIRIYENSNVIQILYSDLDVKDKDNPPDWGQIRAGIKNHDGSEYNYPFACQTDCGRDDFPSLRVVQYGVWRDYPDWTQNNVADIIAEIDPESVESGIDRDENGNETAWVRLEGGLRNISELAADAPMRYRIYLAPEETSYSLGYPELRLSHAQFGDGYELGGWPDADSFLPITSDDPNTPEIEDRIVINKLPTDPIPTGLYHLCIYFEGLASQQRPYGSDNDFFCHPEPIKFGPDLTGEILDFPPTAKPLEPFKVRLVIRNEGNRAAVVSDDPADDPLSFEVRFVAEAYHGAISLARPDGRKVVDPFDLLNYDKFVGRLLTTLEPGEEESFEVEVMYPFSSNDGVVNFNPQLWISGNWTADGTPYMDADDSNNAVTALDLIELLLPDYMVQSGEGKFDFYMPMGCILGEPVRGRYEICNRGKAEGFGFRPTVHLKVGEQPGEFDETNGIVADLLPSCLGIVEPDDPQDERILRDDQSLCDEGSICSMGSCWTMCDPEDSLENNGCAPGFKCLRNPFVFSVHENVDYTCMPFLEQNECHVYEFEATFPMDSRRWNSETDQPPFDPIPDMSMVMPFLMPNPDAAPEEAYGDYVHYDEDNEVGYLCQYPRPDIVAEGLPTMEMVVVAGTPFNIERRFGNLGPLGVEFEYGYYLSPVPEVSPKQWPVPVLGSPNELGRAFIERNVMNEDWTTTRGIEQRFDTVRVLPGTPPGEYFFGVVVDPHGQLEELDKANNTFIYPYLIRVREPDLIFETNYLPVATVGVRYNFSLWASGGMGNYRWEKGEGFPPWLDLDPQTGHLSGTPTEAKDYVVSIRVRSGALEQQRVFPLRVIEPEGELSIPNHVFPVAVSGLPYGPIELKANGGKPPYTWTTSSLDGRDDGMPSGMCSENGIIRSGRCGETDHSQLPNIPPGAYRFLAIVEDSRGATAERELTIHVAGGSALTILTETVGNGIVGNPYTVSCVRAAGGNPDNYEWTVEGLPRGLSAVPSTAQVCIEGVPEEFGPFMVRVTVSDEGMQASREFVMEIANQELALERSHLGEFVQGAPVKERLQATLDAEITIVQGRLPSGLEFHDNWIEGTISETAEPGSYTLLLELRTEMGHVSPAGLGITVLPAEKKVVEDGDDGGGCGSSATGSPAASALGFAAVILGLFGMRFRRSVGLN